MPLRYDFKETGVVIWYWGVVEGRDLVPANRAIYEHEFEGEFKYQFIDTTHVTDFNVSPQEIRQIVDDDLQHTAGLSQVAVMVAPDEHIFAISRMWNIQADDSSFRTMVVKTTDQAMAFLKENGIDIETPAFPGEELVKKE